MPRRKEDVGRPASVSVRLLWGRLEKSWFFDLRVEAAQAGKGGEVVAGAVVAPDSVPPCGAKRAMMPLGVEDAVAKRAPVISWENVHAEPCPDF